MTLVHNHSISKDENNDEISKGGGSFGWNFGHAGSGWVITLAGLEQSW